MRGRTNRAMGLAAVLLLLGLPLAWSAGAITTTLSVSGTVTNAAPTLGTPTWSVPTLVPVPGGNAVNTMAVVVTDLNGFQDVAGGGKVELNVDGPAGRVVTAEAAACSETSSVDVYCDYAVTLAYFLLPGTYTLRLWANDTASASASLSTSFSYAGAYALGLQGTSIPFATGGGSVSPGATGDAVPHAIHNYGNLPTSVWGSMSSDLVCCSGGGTIGKSKVIARQPGDPVSEFRMDVAPTRIGTYQIPVGSGSSAQYTFQVEVPLGTRAGAYTGAITLASD